MIGMRNNKRICRIAMILLLAFCAAGWLGIQRGPAFAAGEAALDVYYDDTCLKSFSMRELESIAAKEGNRKYTYSGFNTYPTGQLFKDIEGPTVKGILDAALQGSGGLKEISDTQLIGFRAGDGMEEDFLKGTLFTARSYFPNFKQEQGREGQAVLRSSMADPVQVPAVISLKEEGYAYGESGHYEVGRLLFGQVSPSEQNHSVFVKYMATKDAESAAKRGRIIIYSAAAKPAQTLQAIRTTDHGKSGAAAADTKIILDRSVNKSHTEGGSRYWIYYTTDGSEPDRNAAMYNYNNYNFGEKNEKNNCPVIGEDDQTMIRTKVFGYDRLESGISEFIFQRAPGKPALKKLTRKGRSVTVKWTAAEDAEGYQICRATKKTGKYKAVKTIGSKDTVSWKDTGVKKGKIYYYKLRAYRTVSGDKVYSSYSAVKNIKVK